MNENLSSDLGCICICVPFDLHSRKHWLSTAKSFRRKLRLADPLLHWLPLGQRRIAGDYGLLEVALHLRNLSVKTLGLLANSFVLCTLLFGTSCFLQWVKMNVKMQIGLTTLRSGFVCCSRNQDAPTVGVNSIQVEFQRNT